jgi:hypothetical protein
MAALPPPKDDRSAGPLTGMSWSLESPAEHWRRHDRDQVRYWLSRPPSERLARADEYRVRVFGEGPYTLSRTFRMLPSIVSSHVE